MATATCISSGNLTDDTQLWSSGQRGLLHGVTVTVAGTDNAQVRVYDGDDNTGNLLAVVRVSGDVVRTEHQFFNRPVRSSSGLFVEVLGNPSRAIVYYG